MIKTRLYADVRNNVESGINTILIGPTGSTKTASAALAMRDMIDDGKLDAMHIVQITPGVEDIDLVTKLLLDGKGGVKEIKGPLRLAFDDAAAGKRVGVIIDEINRGEPTTTNILITAIDRVHGAYRLSDFVVGETIVVPLDRLVFVATANIGSAYHGTSRIDEALMDRFGSVIYVDYDLGLEKQLAGEYQFAVEVGRAVRAAYKGGKISAPFSTRQLINWIDAIKSIGKKPSKKQVIEAAHRTWVYRVVGTDGFGLPDSNELQVISGILRNIEV